jgi:hypothetical protein
MSGQVRYQFQNLDGDPVNADLFVKEEVIPAQVVGVIVHPTSLTPNVTLIVQVEE